MTYTPRTLKYCLSEATIRSRSREDAIRSAAEHARNLGGRNVKASVYHDPKTDSYSYGIKSRSTGGKRAPKGSPSNAAQQASRNLPRSPKLKRSASSWNSAPGDTSPAIDRHPTCDRIFYTFRVAPQKTRQLGTNTK